MNHSPKNKNPFNNSQLELLKSLTYITTETQQAAMKSLLKNYFAHQLGTAISQLEEDRNYTFIVY